jgi:hypothetical protein
MRPRFLRLLIKTRGLFGLYSVQPITVWDKLEKASNLFEFNHIEGGHPMEWKPIAKGAWQQKSWHNQAWRRSYAYLVDGVCHYV